MKTYYVPAGETRRLRSLHVKKLVVNGRLEVEELLQADSIRGTGSVHAGRIEAQNIRITNLKSHFILARSIMAQTLTARNCTVSGSIAVSLYVKCQFLRAGYAVVVLYDVERFAVSRLVCLSAKSRGFLRTSLAALRQNYRENRSRKQEQRIQKKNKAKACKEPEDDLCGALIRLIPLLKDNGYRLEIDPEKEAIAIHSKDAA